MTSSPAEIPLADATGDVRLIYDAIADALGVRLVNLVFRHFATKPGCLEWSWSVLESGLRTGTFARDARQLVAPLTQQAVSAGRAVSLSELGLRRAEAEGVLRTVDAYNRANPINAICLQVLERAVREAHAAPRFRSPPAAARRLDALLPMAPLNGLPASTLELLHDLARLTVGGTIVPSIFRHFTDWPDLLRAFSEILEDVSGSFAEAGDRVEASAREIAEAAVLPSGDGAGPDEAMRETLSPAIGLFLPAICRMIVVGGHIRGGLRR